MTVHQILLNQIIPSLYKHCKYSKSFDKGYVKLQKFSVQNLYSKL